MAVSGYQVGAVYSNGVNMWGGSSTALGRAVLYMAGASLAAPAGSNLPAPAPVGRYGAFTGLTGSNNLTASAVPTESKQFPMRVGKIGVFVTFVNLSRSGVGSLVPAYGN